MVAIREGTPVFTTGVEPLARVTPYLAGEKKAFLGAA